MNTEQHLIAFKNYMNYRRYSENTIKTYSDALEVFFRSGRGNRCSMRSGQCGSRRGGFRERGCFQRNN